MGHFYSGKKGDIEVTWNQKIFMGNCEDSGLGYYAEKGAVMLKFFLIYLLTIVSTFASEKLMINCNLTDESTGEQFMKIYRENSSFYMKYKIEDVSDIDRSVIISELDPTSETLADEIIEMALDEAKINRTKIVKILKASIFNGDSLLISFRGKANIELKSVVINGSIGTATSCMN